MGRRYWKGGTGDEVLGRRYWGGGTGEEVLGRRYWGGGTGEEVLGLACGARTENRLWERVSAMWLSLPAKWTSQVTKLCCAVTMSSVPMRCGMPGPLIGPCLYYCHVITGHSDVLSLQEMSPCAGCCNHVLPLHCPHHKISPPPPPPCLHVQANVMVQVDISISRHSHLLLPSTSSP